MEKIGNLTDMEGSGLREYQARQRKEKRKRVAGTIGAIVGMGILGFAILNNPYTRSVNRSLEKELARSEAQTQKQEKMNPEVARVWYEGNVPKYAELSGNIYQVEGVLGAKSDLGIMNNEVKQFYNWDKLRNLAFYLNNENPNVRTDRTRYTLGKKIDYEKDSPQLNSLDERVISTSR
jgi:hypothetical protein